MSYVNVNANTLVDPQSNPLKLIGVNVNGFEDHEGGLWLGSLGWDINKANQELDQIKSWGINTIRCHQSIDFWKYNTNNHKSIIKELLTLAALKGIIVIYDYFQIKNYKAGGHQAGLPYPPYQNDADESNIIANEQDFVDLWTDTAKELKDYPNIVFELWNEPIVRGTETETGKQSWFNTSQLCIDAIRSQGATQPIIIQWWWDCWIGNPLKPNWGGVFMSWMETFKNLSDPENQLIFSSHLYGEGGAYGNGDYKVYDYDLVKASMQYELIEHYKQTYPIIIGEIGANINDANDITAFDNALTVLEEWDIPFAGFWYRPTGIYRLIENWRGDPTASGSVLMNHQSDATQIPPIGTPSPIPQPEPEPQQPRDALASIALIALLALGDK